MKPSFHFIEWILQDWSSNTNSFKSRLILLFFRLTQSIEPRSGLVLNFIRWFIVATYTIIEWIIGVDLPPTVVAGKGLQLFHIVGLVVHPATIIGEGCILRHCTTLGSKGGAGNDSQKAPVIGDRVDIGCNSVIIGHVSVGNDSVIGAGAVVVRDVPEKVIVCGNPAKIVGFRS